MGNLLTAKYRFGDLLVDVDTRRVLRAGQEIHLPELSFDVLVALIRHAPSVVSKQQLMDEVWQGIIVEADTVTKRITLLRRSLEDNKQEEPLIRIVRGRGYAISKSVDHIKTNDQLKANELVTIQLKKTIKVLDKVFLYFSDF